MCSWVRSTSQLWSRSLRTSKVPATALRAPVTAAVLVAVLVPITVLPLAIAGIVVAHTVHTRCALHPSVADHDDVGIKARGLVALDGEVGRSTTCPARRRRVVGSNDDRVPQAIPVCPCRRPYRVRSAACSERNPAHGHLRLRRRVP